MAPALCAVVPAVPGAGWRRTGKKVNIERAEEALETEADEIAVASPFCLVMLDDGVKELGREDVPVRDIAMILADGLEASIPGEA